MQKSPGFSGRSKLCSMHLIPTLHTPSSRSNCLALQPAITFLEPTVPPPQPRDHIQVMWVWADKREVKIAIPALSFHMQTFPLPMEMFITASRARENLALQWLIAPLRSTSIYPTWGIFSHEPWQQLSLWCALRFKTPVRISSHISGQGRQRNLFVFYGLVMSWPQSCYRNWGFLQKCTKYHCMWNSEQLQCKSLPDFSIKTTKGQKCHTVVLKISNFHNITQISPYSLSRSPSHSQVLSALRLTYFWPPFFFPLAIPLLCPGPVHSEMHRFKAASNCGKCQQRLVPPWDMSAETTTLAIVPRMSSPTAERQLRYLFCCCRTTSWCGQFSVIFQLP